MDRTEIENWAAANCFVPSSLPSQFILERGGGQIVLEIKRSSLVLIKAVPGKVPHVSTRLFKDAERLLNDHLCA